MKTNKGLPAIPTRARQAGEMDFLMMILGFLVLIFILWVLSGGQNNESSKKPFITPGNDEEVPLQPYGR